MALADLTLSQEIKPDVDTAMALADTYSGMHEAEKALQSYDTAISLAPKDARAYLGRGDIYADRGDFGSAIKDHTRAMSLSPKWSIPCNTAVSRTL